MFLFKNLIYFKITYLVLLICSIVPFISQYTSNFLILSIVFGMLLFFFYVFNKKIDFNNKYLKYFLIFIVILVISVLMNYNKTNVIDELKNIGYTIVSLFIVGYVEPDFSTEEKKFKEIKLISNIAIFLISIITIISIATFFLNMNFEYTIGNTIYYIGMTPNHRLMGITSNCNVFAFATLIAIVSILMNFFSFQSKLYFKVIYIILLLINFLALILIGSRIVKIVVAVFFASLLFLFLNNKYLKILNKTKFSIIFIVFTVFTSSFMIQSFDFVFQTAQRLRSNIVSIEKTIEDDILENIENNAIIIENKTDTTVEKREIGNDYSNGRLSLWKAGYEIIKDYPLFGVGKRGVENYIEEYSNNKINKKVYTSMHNIFFEIGVDYGLIALMVFIMIGLSILRDSLRIVFNKIFESYDDYKFFIFLFVVIISFFIQNLAEANILFNMTLASYFFSLYTGYFVFILNKECQKVKSGGNNHA